MPFSISALRLIQEEHAWLRSLGFDLFQGHYLQFPLVSRAKRLPHNRAALLQLLSMLYDPKLDVRSLEGMIAADVGLSVRLIFRTGPSPAAAPISVDAAIARASGCQI